MRGFTLVEVLIALVLFAILAAMTAGSLYHSFQVKERMTRQAEQLNTLQLSLSLLRQDIEQISPRLTRDNDFNFLSIFVGKTDSIEFTRGGFPNPNGLEQRSTLKHIALLCEKNRLIRRSWERLDPLDPGIFKTRILLDNLKSCHFKFLNSRQQILSEWRVNEMPRVAQDSNPERLPQAVQLNIELSDWGVASFWYIIPAAMYSHV